MSWDRNYRSLLSDIGVYEHEYCSNPEQEEFIKMGKDELPPGVYKETGAGQYFRYLGADQPEEKIQTFVLAQCAHTLRTIKNCAIFFIWLVMIFVVLVIIGLAFQIISSLI